VIGSFFILKINFHFSSSKCAVEEFYSIVVDSALAMFCLLLLVLFLPMCAVPYTPCQAYFGLGTQISGPNIFRIKLALGWEGGRGDTLPSLKGALS
jgi:hypothetical protein